VRLSLSQERYRGRPLSFPPVCRARWRLSRACASARACFRRLASLGCVTLSCHVGWLVFGARPRSSGAGLSRSLATTRGCVTGGSTRRGWRDIRLIVNTRVRSSEPREPDETAGMDNEFTEVELPSELACEDDLRRLVATLWRPGWSPEAAAVAIGRRLPEATVTARRFDDGDRVVRLAFPWGTRDIWLRASGQSGGADPHRSPRWLSVPVQPGQAPRLPRPGRRSLERLLVKGHVHAMTHEGRVRLYEGGALMLLIRPPQPRCRPRGAGRPRSRRRRQLRATRAGPADSDGSDGESSDGATSSSARSCR
jgi:hypothetical protein